MNFTTRLEITPKNKAQYTIGPDFGSGENVINSLITIVDAIRSIVSVLNINTIVSL